MKNKASHSSSPRPDAPRRAHYVVSTHWDREWYQTFQGFRHRLVHLLDRVIADLESGALAGPFTLDGQFIVVDDYLEIRPEQTERVHRLLREGRLVAGPWFVLPDEWLVSGESLVRNLQFGRTLTRRLGATPSNAGFVCDLFGHVSQLPQILAGFGIDAAMVWRGLRPRQDAYLWWESPDGTRILCYRFPRTAYCDVAWDLRRSHQHDSRFEAERLERDLKTYLERETKRAPFGPMLLFDGGDHLEHDVEFYRALINRAPSAEFPFTVKHSTLDDFLAELKTQAGRVTQRVVGELRETGDTPCAEDQQWLIPGVLSSRVWIKQANARCQSLLCQWAEPFSAFASQLAGTKPAAGFLEVAWRWLLTNHPHDSICGCSIDAVHEDMKYRFAQSSQIAESVAQESLRVLAASVAGAIGEKELRVLVANPLTRQLDETIDLELHIPGDWGCFNEFFGFEPKPGFRIFDEAGREIPYQRLAQRMGGNSTRIFARHFPQVHRSNRVTVALRLRLPALGYVTLTVREGSYSGKDDVIAASMLPTRHPNSPGLATSERSMANEALAVVIECNGALTLTDRRSGEVYDRLLTLEDIADIGDGWYHGQATNDQAFVSTAAAAEIALVADGPEVCTFRIRSTLRVPAEFNFERMVRSATLRDLVVDHHVTLRRGGSRLEVRTTVTNTVLDHRLRVLFPSGVAVDTYLADSAFDVVERPVALPADNHLARELAVETRPQQTWTAVARRRRGLAIVAPGLLETAVRDQAERPIALTLFRATRRTVFTDGEPGGQLQGELNFNYWICPVAGGIDRTRLCEDGLLLGAGLRSVQLARADLADPFVTTKPVLPPRASFIRVHGTAVVTSVREDRGAIEVRFFNPTTRATRVTVDFHDRPAPAPHTATKVDFEQRPIGRPQRVIRGRVKVSARAKEIVTLRFT